jgi:hypothetical protein
MESRDFVEQFERVCKSLAVVMVPVILALTGHAVNGHIESQKLAVQQQQVDQGVLKEAMNVIFRATDAEKLFGRTASIEARRLYRAHWLKVYNEHGKVEIPDEFVAAVMEQAAYELASAPSAEKESGWVLVGVFDKRQGDLNFDLPTGKTRLEKGMIIRARWSVPLRKNFDEAYGGDSGPNPAVYRLAGNQCATVIEVEDDVRRQAWAKVEASACKPEQQRVAQAS